MADGFTLDSWREMLANGGFDFRGGGGEAITGQDPARLRDSTTSAQLAEAGFPPQVIDQLLKPENADVLNRVRGKSYGDAALTLADAQLTPSQIEARAEYSQERGGDFGPPQDAPEAPAAPAGPDILQQEQDRFMEGLRPLADEMGQAGLAYADRLGGIGRTYRDDVLGSEGYAGLGDYRDEMQGIYEQGGLTDVTRANLERSRREANQWNRAQREAMLQDLAERGMAGGGAEIAAGIGDRAAASDRMSARDLDTNAFAQEQALAALKGAYGANQDILDVDRDVSKTVADYDTEGAAELMDISRYLTETGINAWQDIEKTGRSLKQDLYRQGARDVLPAAESAADSLTTTSNDTIDTTRGVVADTVGDVNAVGGNYTGMAGQYTPLPGAPPPITGMGSGAAAGAAAEQGANAGGAIIGGLIDGLSGDKTSTGEDDDDDA